MQGLEKKANSFVNASIATAVAFLALGISFLIFPESSLEVMRWLIAILALIAGIYLIANDLSRRHYFLLFSTMGLGVVSIIIGMIFIKYPNVMNLFPIILGAWFIITSVTSLRFIAAIRGSSGYAVALITSILSLICGLLLLLDPWNGQISMILFDGIMIIVYELNSIVDMFILKKNIKEISNRLKQSFKTINQSEEK